MSDWDDTISDADAALFDVMGDPAVLTNGVTTHTTAAIIDRDLQLIVDDRVQLYGTVATLNAPPSNLASGWTLTIGSTVYTLREQIERDNWVTRWAVTEA